MHFAVAQQLTTLKPKSAAMKQSTQKQEAVHLVVATCLTIHLPIFAVVESFMKEILTFVHNAVEICLIPA